MVKVCMWWRVGCWGADASGEGTVPWKSRVSEPVSAGAWSGAGVHRDALRRLMATKCSQWRQSSHGRREGGSLVIGSRGWGIVRRVCRRDGGRVVFMSDRAFAGGWVSRMVIRVKVRMRCICFRLVRVGCFVCRVVRVGNGAGWWGGGVFAGELE